MTTGDYVFKTRDLKHELFVVKADGRVVFPTGATREQVALRVAEVFRAQASTWDQTLDGMVDSSANGQLTTERLRNELQAARDARAHDAGLARELVWVCIGLVVVIGFVTIRSVVVLRRLRDGYAELLAKGQRVADAGTRLATSVDKPGLAKTAAQENAGKEDA